MKEDEIPETHAEVEVGRPVRTADDNVVFPGKAVVNKRQVAGIEAAEAEEVNKTRSMMDDDEATEDESGKLLGDTRTSAGKKGAAARKGGRKGK